MLLICLIVGFAIEDQAHPGIAVEACVSNYQPPNVVIGNYVDIEVTHVDNLDQFWCHLLTSDEEMEGLMTSLQEYYEVNPPKSTDSSSFTKGLLCIYSTVFLSLSLSLSPPPFFSPLSLFFLPLLSPSSSFSHLFFLPPLLSPTSSLSHLFFLPPLLSPSSSFSFLFINLGAVLDKVKYKQVFFDNF